MGDSSASTPSPRAEDTCSRLHWALANSEAPTPSSEHRLGVLQASGLPCGQPPTHTTLPTVQGGGWDTCSPALEGGGERLSAALGPRKGTGAAGQAGEGGLAQALGEHSPALRAAAGGSFRVLAAVARPALASLATWGCREHSGGKLLRGVLRGQ